MAIKKYWNGVIFGIVLGVLALAASEVLTAVKWVGTVIMNPLANWLQSQTWMPVFLADLSWFNYLVAGAIGAIIGLWIEVR